MAAGAATSSVTSGVTVTAAELESPTHVLKKQKVVRALTAFEAIQAAYVMSIGPTVGVQIENVSSAPLASMEIIHSAAGEPSLSDLISQASVKETPTVFAAHEATSIKDPVVSDVGGSSSGIVDDEACLGDDLYLPTINWDPNMQDKCYQPKWKIAESSSLIFPPVIQHWIERAYPPAESAYVEGLNNENLMNSTMVDSRILWARDIAEKDRVLAHTKSVQEELECKAITEAQKLRSEMSAQVEKLQIDTDFVSQVQERYQALTAEVETSNAKARAK
ncbi:hypothetical protein Hanom_Chr06g00549871 [Helianthus anomalus]